MKILVTGALGTLGRPLVQELRSRGNSVLAVDVRHSGEALSARADVAEYRQMAEVMEFWRPDVVYHLAAEFGRHNGESYYEQVWKTNVIGTKNIIDLCANLDIRLIFASSSEIYGEIATEKYLQEDLSEIYTLRQHNDYAISKWVNEQQIMNAEEQLGLKAVRLRFFNAYGPGEHFHNFRSVIALFCYKALTNDWYTVYKGYHRVFMFIDDFIPTLANVCLNFREGSVYNIGGDEYRSVKEASDIVIDYLDMDDSKVNYQEEDEHNVMSKRPDISKARNDLGHDPKMKLEEGIPMTIEWMRSVYGFTFPVTSMYCD